MPRDGLAPPVVPVNQQCYSDIHQPAVLLSQHPFNLCVPLSPEGETSLPVA